MWEPLLSYRLQLGTKLSTRHTAKLGQLVIPTLNQCCLHIVAVTPHLVSCLHPTWSVLINIFGYFSHHTLPGDIPKDGQVDGGVYILMVFERRRGIELMDGLRPYFKESIDVGGRNLCATVKKVCKLKLSFAVEGSPISRLGCFSGRWWCAWRQGIAM